MKKVLCLMLVLCLALPATVQATKKRQVARSKVFTAPDTMTADEKQVFEGKSRVKLGKEFVFVSKDLTQASFTKNAVCTEKRQIKYVCICRKIIRTRPGKCPCDKGLLPVVQMNDNLYLLERNEVGQLLIKPFVAADTSSQPECCGGKKTDCPTCGKCAPKTNATPAPSAAAVSEKAKTDVAPKGCSDCCGK